MKATATLDQAIAEQYVVAQQGHSPLAAAYRRHCVESGIPFLKVTLRGGTDPLCQVEVDLVGQSHRLSPTGYFEVRELLKRAHMGQEKPSNATHSRTLMLSKRVKVVDAPALVKAILAALQRPGALEQWLVIRA